MDSLPLSEDANGAGTAGHPKAPTSNGTGNPGSPNPSEYEGEKQDNQTEETALLNLQEGEEKSWALRGPRSSRATLGAILLLPMLQTQKMI